MARESTDLSNFNYDRHLAEKGKTSRSARQELEQRKVERKHAHDGDGVGYHFGLGDGVVRTTSKEHFKHELNKRGLMLATEVNKDLRGPRPHEFKGRQR